MNERDPFWVKMEQESRRIERKWLLLILLLLSPLLCVILTHILH